MIVRWHGKEENLKTETRYILLGVGVMFILGAILAFGVSGTNDATVVAMNKLKIATGFGLLALIFLFGLSVLVYIANGNIDLSDLLSESDSSKGASMSRFQLLIFTLVISLSLFLVVAANMKFPDTIPPEILTLLGISASTFAVSKGIQVSGNQKTTTASAPGVTVTTTAPSSTPTITKATDTVADQSNATATVVTDPKQ